MSTKYRTGEEVPDDVLCARLNKLSDAVTKGPRGINSEFYMRVPAECDNDADLVLSEAAARIIKLKDAWDSAFKQAMENGQALLLANQEIKGLSELLRISRGLECDELRHLLNKLNKVTSNHRHGRFVSKDSLTDLANAQVEYEQRNKS